MEAQLRRGFADRFGRPPEVIAFAPGRVNLIGEHTDYTEGWVLPMALDRGTWVAAGRREERWLHAVARRLDGADQAPLDDLDPAAGPPWSRYVRGAAAVWQDLGLRLPGAALAIDGRLPLGAGLSSSASLVTAVASALALLAGHTATPTELAHLVQRVEHEHAGVACGLMDPLAIAGGVAGCALLIDCRSLAIVPVPIPAEATVLILDSGERRPLADSAYNARRAECAAALAQLQAAAPRGYPTIRALRDVSPEQLAAAGAQLDGVLARRARHVVAENARVLQAAERLRGGDAAGVGALMTASHLSLRDDFAVSTPRLDRLVEIAWATPGILGARMTGAGFGGCAVALATTASAQAARRHITARYRAAIGRPAQAFTAVAGRGAWVLWADSDEAAG
jgi:galactokinase